MSDASDKLKIARCQLSAVITVMAILWLEKKLLWPENLTIPYRIIASIHWPMVFIFIFLACLFLFTRRLLTIRPVDEPPFLMRLYLILLHLLFLWLFWRFGYGWLLAAGTLSLVLAVFRRRDIHRMALPIIFSFTAALIIYYLALFIKWLYELPMSLPTTAVFVFNRLSYLIAWLVKWGLSLLGYSATLDFTTTPRAPIITVETLSLQISLACSGIESMFLFAIFFL